MGYFFHQDAFLYRISANAPHLLLVCERAPVTGSEPAHILLSGDTLCLFGGHNSAPMPGWMVVDAVLSCERLPLLDRLLRCSHKFCRKKETVVNPDIILPGLLQSQHGDRRIKATASGKLAA